MKKSISLLLALIMVFSLLSLSAGATGFTDNDLIKNTDAVDTCIALNIINGKGDGSYFDPAGIVTREEMCKMICVALNGGKNPEYSTAVDPFSDVPAARWSAGFIAYCVENGIVDGYGDGNFGPDDTLTGYQWGKMLLCAIGYGADAEGFTGANWETNVAVRANQKGLYERLEGINPSAGLSRDNSAQLIYNGIFADMVKYEYGVTGNQIAVDVKDKTIASEKYNLKETTGILSNISYDAEDGLYCYSILTSPRRNPGDTTADTFATFYSKKDYSSLMGMNCKVFWKDKTENNGGFNKSEDAVYSIVHHDHCKKLAQGSLMSVDPNTTDELSLGGKKYALEDDLASAANLPVYYFNFCNEQQAVLGNLLDTWSHTELSLIDYDSNDKVDYAVAIPRKTCKVTKVGGDSVTLTDAPTGESLGAFTRGNADYYSGIAKDDYVCVTEGKYTPNGKWLVTEEDIITWAKVTSETRTGVSGKEARRVYSAGTLTGGEGKKNAWHYLAYDVSAPNDLKGADINCIFNEGYYLITDVIYPTVTPPPAPDDEIMPPIYNVALLVNYTPPEDEDTEEGEEPETAQADLLFADPAKPGEVVTRPVTPDESLGDFKGSLVLYTRDANGVYTLTPIDVETPPQRIFVGVAMSATIAPSANPEDVISFYFDEGETGMVPMIRKNEDTFSFSDNAVVFVELWGEGGEDYRRISKSLLVEFRRNYTVENAYTYAGGRIIALAYLREAEPDYQEEPAE